MDIEQFKKKNSPKKTSNLRKFESDIMELRNLNYSLKSITQYLQKKGVITTFQNLSKFLKSASKEIKNTTISKSVTSEKVKSDNFQYNGLKNQDNFSA